MLPLTKVTLFANVSSKPKCPAGSSLVGLSAATARTVRSLTHSRLIHQASERLTTRAGRVEIEYEYLRATLEQLSNEVIAQEAGGSGQEIFLGGHFFLRQPTAAQAQLHSALMNSYTGSDIF